MSEAKPSIRQRVIQYLRTQTEPLSSQDIAEALDLTTLQVGSVIYQLKDTYGLKKHGEGPVARWSMDPNFESGESVKKSTPRSGPTMMDKARELILNDPEREYTTEYLAEALQIDHKQAINLAGRLKQTKFVTSRFKNGNTYYKLSSKQGNKEKTAKPKKAPQDQQQLSILPSVQLSMEAENAMQTFAHALMQLENLRAENERLKQALTQILSIGSNAILK